MRDIAAIHAALTMAETPALLRSARRSALPPGMTFLLEVAANDTAAIAAATTLTGQSDETLRAACGFFIEQILLTNNEDSYRVLAASSDADASALRRHMALLMKWLHPDVAANAEFNNEIDRSVFANRVTQAWEDLKTEERRAAYARSIRKKNNLFRRKRRHHRRDVKSTQPARKAPDQKPGTSRKGTTSQTKKKMYSSTDKRRRHKRLIMRPLGQDSLFSRLVLFLKGQR